MHDNCIAGQRLSPRLRRPAAVVVVCATSIARRAIVPIQRRAATAKIVIDDPYRYHPSGDTTTPIEIIQPTKEALAELEDILLDKAIAVVSEKALDVGNDVQSLAEQIASKYDAVCTPINYKSAESIKRKVLLERQNPLTANFTPEMLKDAVRTTIIAPQDKIASVIDSLKKNELFLRYKSQGGDEYIGYVGNIVNIKTTNGLAAEIQINTAKMIYAKDLPCISQKLMQNIAIPNIAKSKTAEPLHSHADNA